eukprot:2038499-Heterocapsa_arctica.AAC.1
MAIARMPNNMNKNVKNLQKPSKPYTPVCVHLTGPLISAPHFVACAVSRAHGARQRRGKAPLQSGRS